MRSLNEVIGTPLRNSAVILFFLGLAGWALATLDMSDTTRIMGVVAMAGAVGGIINALLSDSGVEMPQYDSETNVFKPGMIGNVLIGAVAAIVLYGLYGPLKDSIVAGTRPAPPATVSLSMSELVAGLATGIAGARILSAEVEKKVLRAQQK